MERNRSITDKLGVQSTVQEIRQDQQKWLQHLQRLDTDRVPCSINEKGEETLDAQRNDGRTKFTFRVKEETLCLTLQSSRRR